MSQKGEVMLRKTLDYEKTDAYSFVVYVTDGKRNDSARVNVSVLNINDWDPRFKYPQYEFHIRGGDVGGNDFLQWALQPHVEPMVHCATLLPSP